MTFFFLTFLVFSIDQVSKHFAFQSGILVYRNFGITFGLFPGNIPVRIFYWLVTYFLILWLMRYYFVRRGQRDFLTSLSLSFVLGGALGNTFDKITRGYVVDFINFGKLMPFWSANFYNNLADVFIVIGALILVFEYLRRSGGYGLNNPPRPL